MLVWKVSCRQFYSWVCAPASYFTQGEVWCNPSAAALSTAHGIFVLIHLMWFACSVFVRRSCFCPVRLSLTLVIGDQILPVVIWSRHQDISTMTRGDPGWVWAATGPAIKAGTGPRRYWWMRYWGAHRSSWSACPGLIARSHVWALLSPLCRALMDPSSQKSWLTGGQRDREEVPT